MPSRRRRSSPPSRSAGGSQFFDPNGTLPRALSPVHWFSSGAESDPGLAWSGVPTPRTRTAPPERLSITRPRYFLPPRVPPFVKERSVLPTFAPARVRFCIQRSQRREVLFALNRAGFSGSARKRHWHRTGASQFSCRR